MAVAWEEGAQPGPLLGPEPRHQRLTQLQLCHCTQALLPLPTGSPRTSPSSEETWLRPCVVRAAPSHWA